MVWKITPGFSYDTDAAAYITAVETADGQALETGTRYAINNFVIGCKADGIWTAIKASCILAGARTLAGALVPLVGAAPTNFNFTTNDYNRKTGLKGNGSSKYLNSNINDNIMPQNNAHCSAYVSEADANGSNSFKFYMGVGNAATSYLGIARINQLTGLDGVSMYIRSANYQRVGDKDSVGFMGASRSASSTFAAQINLASITASQTSFAPNNRNIIIYAINDNGSLGSHTNGRLAFYSIGESLSLVNLGSRVTDLINALAVAIP